jgi:transposase, IS5 family
MKWDNVVFHHNTIRDNVSLLKKDTLKKIINLTSVYGRTVLGSVDSKLKIKTDSYVFETNVHFPTDLNLLWDCMEKCINIITSNDKYFSLGGFRKHKSWISKIKKVYRSCSSTVYSGGKNKEERLKKSVSSYLENLETISSKIVLLMNRGKALNICMDKLESYHTLLDKHIDLIARRLLKNEIIPHSEKLFSIYEQHTEWINKGKRHPSVELGHRILITTDENNLIVDFKVMVNETDEQQVEGVYQRVETLFGQNSIGSMSFDKGFSSLKNKIKTLPHTDILCMPKKGKKNHKEIEEERELKFVKLRHQHSAIESNINCLEHHGLDKCPDKGIEGYTRYTYIGILSYNLHKIGNCILDRKRELLLKAA